MLRLLQSDCGDGLVMLLSMMVPLYSFFSSQEEMIIFSAGPSWYSLFSLVVHLLFSWCYREIGQRLAGEMMKKMDIQSHLLYSPRLTTRKGFWVQALQIYVFLRHYDRVGNKQEECGWQREERRYSVAIAN